MTCTATKVIKFYATSQTQDNDKEIDVDAVMTLLRALESGSCSRVNRILSRHPSIAPSISAWNRDSWTQEVRNNLRSRALELEKDKILRSLLELSSFEDGNEEAKEAKANTRRQIGQRIKTFASGSPTTLFAVSDSSGVIHTGTMEIANILQCHWKHVFAKRRIMQERLDKWLAEEKKSPPYRRKRILCGMSSQKTWVELSSWLGSPRLARMGYHTLLGKS